MKITQDMHYRLQAVLKDVVKQQHDKELGPLIKQIKDEKEAIASKVIAKAGKANIKKKLSRLNAIRKKIESLYVEKDCIKAHLESLQIDLYGAPTAGSVRSDKLSELNEEYSKRSEEFHATKGVGAHLLKIELSDNKQALEMLSALGIKLP